MAELILYGSDGCHLCEDAETLLARAGAHFVKQEILNDDAVYQHYALRIPVLRDPADGTELNWPFNAEQVAAFLAER
ncbi:glutaredoxin family protein [Methylomonas sp. MS20]|uniref:glutaredoxin family protein n=1 Tax=unclassified Methylomonas TaxID=2608980 RepID=UPI0028A3CD63|nr:glutaredoxin family protein [Methylomonas sp. MV1]MDT4330485.1 glutaredoxin family protein [Methylomonas sp. MV1]